MPIVQLHPFSRLRWVNGLLRLFRVLLAWGGLNEDDTEFIHLVIDMHGETGEGRAREPGAPNIRMTTATILRIIGLIDYFMEEEDENPEEEMAANILVYLTQALLLFTDPIYADVADLPYDVFGIYEDTDDEDDHDYTGSDKDDDDRNTDSDKENSPPRGYTGRRGNPAARRAVLGAVATGDARVNGAR